MNNSAQKSPDITGQQCPLCKTADTGSFYTDGHRVYLYCGVCSLVFVPSLYFLSSEEEKARYDLHRNSPDDAYYRRFLSRLVIPMEEFLTGGSRGLDFGSGPGPTLSVMFEEKGHSMSIYDHYYAHEPAVLEKQYDFITATEVMEHLHDPGKELDRLWTCLKPGGCLGIMTKLVIDRDAFARWHYKNDPTHVCFFSRKTFEWLAGCWQAEMDYADKDVILFHKKI